MTTRIVFNGALLIRPGAATKIDVSAFNMAAIAGLGTVALVGNADGGAPRVVQSFLTPKGVRDEYRAGDLVDAASILGSPGNDSRVPGGATRILCYKVNNSTRSELTLQCTTTAQVPAQHQIAAETYLVNPGEIFTWSDDLGGPYNHTFAGTPGGHTGSGAPTLPMAGETLLLNVNKGPQFTVTFGVEATLAAVITTLNTALSGAFADDVGGALRLESTQFGTDSEIIIDPASTALTKLALTAGTYGGTGDGANLAALTSLELKAALEGTGSIVVNTPAIPLVPPTPAILESVTQGAAGQLIVSASTPVDLNTRLGATPGTYNGSNSALADSVKISSKDYGVHNNSIGFQLTTPGGSDRQVVIIWDIDGQVTTETSPVIANQAKFSIQYTGTGTACTMSTTSLQLTTSVTAGPGGEDLTLYYTDYDNISDLVAAINSAAGGVYSAIALTSDASFYNPTNLDWITAIDIKSAVYNVFARCYDVVDWVNTNSDICIAERLTTGVSVPDVFSGTKYLSGAIKGLSDNTEWNTNATLALSIYRADQVVPLCDENPSASVGTYTFDSVAASYTTHAQVMSSTAGKNERQTWIGAKLNKAGLVTLARNLNSEHTVLTADRLYLPAGTSGDITELPTWSSAVALAGMRAATGGNGEPLTWKFVKSFGIGREYDPDADGEIEELLLSGVTLVLEDLDTGGYKIEKCITTYTKSENNAYTEESIVQIWKLVSYDLRTNMERQFTGTKANQAKRVTMIGYADGILKRYWPEERGGNGALTYSSEPDGTVLAPHRDLDVRIGSGGDPSDVARMDVTISPVSGINFQLQTIFVVPAQIA